MLCCVRTGCSLLFFFFFFKQKTAYELRISDWSSDVCSSDLPLARVTAEQRRAVDDAAHRLLGNARDARDIVDGRPIGLLHRRMSSANDRSTPSEDTKAIVNGESRAHRARRFPISRSEESLFKIRRSEEQTSELQSLMRIS